VIRLHLHHFGFRKLQPISDGRGRRKGFQPVAPAPIRARR
jgi:hypothetical protein